MLANREFLMTGATGQLGPMVLRASLEKIDPEMIHLLVRNKEKAMKSLEAFGLPSRDFRYIQGDVTTSTEGLQSIIPQSVTDILHMAGSVKFGEDQRDDVTAINLGGAINIAQLARSRGAHLTHISTAYILGKSDRIIPEDWTPSEGIRNPKNPYEQVKGEAEDAIKEIFSGNSEGVNIVRSGILTDSEHRPDIDIPHATMGYFLPFIFLRRALNEQGITDFVNLESLKLCGNPETEINIVDNTEAGKIVSEIAIGRNKKRITNLVNRKAPSYLELTTWVLRELGFTGYTIEGCGEINNLPPGVHAVDISGIGKEKAKLRGSYATITKRNYLSYVTHTSHFEGGIETNNEELAIRATRALIGKGGKQDVK